MQSRIQIIAKTEEEALAKARQELRVNEDKLFSSFLGELPEGNNYEILLDVNLSFEARKYIENILKALDLQYQIETRTVSGEKEIHFLIESSENSLLIGKNGNTLDALQTLVRTLISIYSKENIITTLDIGSYRSSRDRKLEILATKTAKEVVKTKVPAKLKPMNSYERHVIHEKLASWRDVYTESEGEGADRAVVIKPKH